MSGCQATPVSPERAAHDRNAKSAEPVTDAEAGAKTGAMAEAEAEIDADTDTMSEVVADADTDTDTDTDTEVITSPERAAHDINARSSSHLSIQQFL